MQQREIEALIQLLEDPDDQVFEHVRSKIEELGLHVIDDLEHAWANTPDPFLQQRIEHVIATIQFENVVEKMKIWLRKKPEDLIHGAILIAKTQYPDINVGQVREKIENIQQAIWLELQDNLTPLEKINTFNQVFYNRFGFSGNLKNVFNPQNNFIHICLERKKGSPIILGILYLAIAQNLSLPMYGVDLPYHFALAFCKYSNSNEGEYDFHQKRVLFYINPISRGIIFSRSEIKDYLKRMKVKEDTSYFDPVNNRQVILALVKHLILCYKNSGDYDKATQLNSVEELFYNL